MLDIKFSTRMLWKICVNASVGEDLVWLIHKMTWCRVQRSVIVDRKADDLFGDQDVWRRVDDRDRREIFDDVVHMLAKKEKVSETSYMYNLIRIRCLIHSLTPHIKHLTTSHGGLCQVEFIWPMKSLPLESFSSIWREYLWQSMDLNTHTWPCFGCYDKLRSYY